MTYVDETTGLPDFRVLDIRRQILCYKDRLCGVCGQGLGKIIAFIGGPICKENKLFVDPPMHPPCAEYSAHVCPHVSNDQARYRPLKTEERETDLGGGIVIKSTVEVASDTRPQEMFIFLCTSYRPYQIGRTQFELGVRVEQEFLEVRPIRTANTNDERSGTDRDG